MITYVAFLRGINVGGHKRIKMADLKSMLEGIGFSNIQTYIQSGNILFQATDDFTALKQKIEHQIQEGFGFTVPVALRTTNELDHIIENCPFEEQPGLNVAFLTDRPTHEAVNKLITCEAGVDEFRVINMNMYVLYRNDIRHTLLTTNFFEKRLSVSMTMRNWNTINKLALMGKSVSQASALIKPPYKN